MWQVRVKSDVHFFNTGKTGGYYVDTYPYYNIDNNTPIEFERKGSKDEYIDKAKMFLHVIGQVVDELIKN